MKYLIGVDPGDKHTGFSVWMQPRQDEPWRQEWAGELGPTEFEDWLVCQIVSPVLRVIAIEEWRLFPHLAAQQGMSDMRTSQCIGVVKFLTRQQNYERPPGGRVDLRLESPQIKKPTRSWAQRRKIETLSDRWKIPLDHAADSELHALHYLSRGKQKIGTPLNKWRKTAIPQLPSTPQYR